MKKILLCQPKHFTIEYQINPWMDVEKNVDQQRVQEEYLKLKKTYIDLGCDIEEIPQVKGLPDMVYITNCGFPVGKTFIKSNYKFAQRKKEAEVAKDYFTKKGFVIKELPENVLWEGEGDLLRTPGGKYFLGWGKRTDQKAKQYLSNYLQTEIIDFKMVDPYYYHLDTCFLPLNETTVAINPLSFEQEGIEKITKLFPNVIHVSKEDNALLACNGVVIDKTVVVGEGISKKLKTNFFKAGFSVKEVPMTEYFKGGGKVKCLSLEFY